MRALGGVGEAALVEQLDRQFAYLLRQEGVRRIIALPRLLSFLEGEPVLALLLEDLLSEFEVQTNRRLTEAETLRGQLSDLWVAHEKQVIAALEPDLTAGELVGYIPVHSMRAYLAKESTVVDLCDSDEVKHSPLRPTIESLGHWLKWGDDIAPKHGRDRSTELVELGTLITHLELRDRHSHRAFKTMADNSAGRAYRRLRHLAAMANPDPAGVTGDLMASLRLVRANEFAGYVHEAPQRHNASPNVVEQASLKIDSDATLLLHELRQRVAVGLSRWALVRRYAARCEGFDRDGLRKAAARDTRNAERVLTLDFARYLFDQGLNPLIDPTLGGLRPDILEMTTASLLYVEAKQYSGSAPKKKLLDAYRQVWSTWFQLRKRFDAPEAFLLVFRRSGPLVVLPATLHHAGYKLHSLLVDLAEDVGSRERLQPLELAAADLLPVTG